MLNNIPPAALFTATWTRRVFTYLLERIHKWHLHSIPRWFRSFGLSLQAKSSIAFWYSVSNGSSLSDTAHSISSGILWVYRWLPDHSTVLFREVLPMPFCIQDHNSRTRSLLSSRVHLKISINLYWFFSQVPIIQIFYFHNDGANCKLLIRRIAMVEDITKLLYVTTYGEDFFLYANMPLSPSRNPSARNMVYRHSSKLALLSAIALVVFSIFLPNSLRRDNSSFISTTHPLAFLEKVGWAKKFGAMCELVLSASWKDSSKAHLRHQKEWYHTLLVPPL